MNIRTVMVVNLLLVLSLFAQRVHAQSVVNQCNGDNDPGFGTNLQTALANGGTIYFDCGSSVTILLTQTYTIDRDTFIDGSNQITLDGGGRVQMFSVRNAGATFSLENLRLRGGIAPPDSGPFSSSRAGVAVYEPGVVHNIGGTVLVQHSIITENTAPLDTIGGVLRITDSQFYGNAHGVINNHQGHVEISDSSFSDNHGTDELDSVIENSLGTLDLENTNFYNNSIQGIGAAIFNGNGVVRIQNCEFTENSASGDGGAIASSGAQTSVIDSEFYNNSAQRGGAIMIGASPPQIFDIVGSHFEGNVAGIAGGAIYRAPSTEIQNLGMRVSNSRFIGNAAPTGGAIHLGSESDNDGLFNVSSTIFSANTAQMQGGAIYGANVDVSVLNSLFVSNSAGQVGGALYLINVAEHSVQLFNSLVVQNMAPVSGGIAAGNLLLTNSTIADNLGGGVSFYQNSPPSTYSINLVNTIIASNLPSNCLDTQVVDGGNNLQFPGITCGVTIRTLYPQLDRFYVPGLTSPARRAGNNAVCNAAPVNGLDLYGQTRGGRGPCTIGAVERDIDRLLQEPAPE